MPIVEVNCIDGEMARGLKELDESVENSRSFAIEELHSTFNFILSIFLFLSIRFLPFAWSNLDSFIASSLRCLQVNCLQGPKKWTPSISQRSDRFSKSQFIDRL